MIPLQVETYVVKDNAFIVIQDGVQPGGTKARILPEFLKLHPAKKYIYAGPKIGYAQVALAVSVSNCGLYLSGGPGLSNPTKLALNYGAKIDGVFKANWQAKEAAKVVAEKSNGEIFNCPFGLDDPDFIRLGIEIISKLVEENCMLSDIRYNNFKLFVTYGSGTIARMLREVFPNAHLCCVWVGREPTHIPDNSTFYKAPEYFTAKAEFQPPYKSVPDYDAKLWRFVLEYGANGDLVWNVAY
jgi:hypothetical protein